MTESQIAYAIRADTEQNHKNEVKYRVRVICSRLFEEGRAGREAFRRIEKQVLEKIAVRCKLQRVVAHMTVRVNHKCLVFFVNSLQMKSCARLRQGTCARFVAGCDGLYVRLIIN